MAGQGKEGHRVSLECGNGDRFLFGHAILIRQSDCAKQVGKPSESDVIKTEPFRTESSCLAMLISQVSQHWKGYDAKAVRWSTRTGSTSKYWGEKQHNALRCRLEYKSRQYRQLRRNVDYEHCDDKYTCHCKCSRNTTGMTHTGNHVR